MLKKIIILLIHFTFINVMDIQAFTSLRDMVDDANAINVTIIKIKKGKYKTVETLSLPIIKNMTAFGIKKEINSAKQLPIENQIVVARWQGENPMVLQNEIKIRKIMKDYYILSFAVLIPEDEHHETSLLFSKLMLDDSMTEEKNGCCF